MGTQTKINWDDITFEQVEDLIDDKVYLYYVDYNDSLDENLELVQECIHKGDAEQLYFNIDEWFMEQPFYAMEELNKQLQSDLESKFDLDETDAQSVIDRYFDEIQDVYYERDHSDVLKDLLKNTSEQVFFYETGFDVDVHAFSSQAEIRLERMRIKKYLGITEMSEKDNRKIDMMLQQSGGGQLVVFFNSDIDRFLFKDLDNLQSIVFGEYISLAVINTWNGSGDHCEVFALDAELPFDKEKVFLDKTVSYSYTYDVCMMNSNWCEGTHIEFKDKNGKYV